jgi:hypothetical protein
MNHVVDTMILKGKRLFFRVRHRLSLREPCDDCRQAWQNALGSVPPIVEFLKLRGAMDKETRLAARLRRHLVCYDDAKQS